jgi:hypothetical protein
MQPGIENQVFSVNQFIAGGMLSSLGVVYDEAALIERLKEIKTDRGANL